MFGDRLDDAAVGILITVSILERILHGFDDVVRRSPAILVAGELRHLVVVFVGMFLPRLTLSRLPFLREQVERGT